MSMSALDSVEDAFDATKRLLLPFTRGTWFKLAAVMLFVAGGGFSPTSFLNVPGAVPGGGSGPPDGGGAQPTPGGPDPGALTPELTPVLVVFLILFVLFVVAAFLLWSVAGATMEFVFVESLGAEEVRLREFFLGNLRPGVRLFVFRTGLGLLLLGGFAAFMFVLAVLVGGWPVSQWGGGVVLLFFFLGLPLAFAVFFVLGLVQGLTTTFVVPVMLAEDRNVLAAWRRFLGVCRTDWKELLVYLLVNWVLGIVIGIATFAITLALLIVLGIPALVVAVPALFLLGGSPVGATIALVVFLAAGVLFFVATLLVAVPFQTFRRYYALFVLGDVDTDLDVVPATRAAVRTDGGDSNAGGDPGGDGGTDGDGENGDSPGAGGSGGGPGDDPGESGSDGDVFPDEPADDGWNVDR